MKVLFAPDKFAGTLTAAEAADAMASGWRRARPDDDVVLRPMADGGEGTVDVIRAARRDATSHVTEVADARGTAVDATWLMLADATAVIESAEACGLSRLPPEDRDPLRLTTYGVGQLLLAARAAGAHRVVVGLGGSATVDGGAGAATALGHRLLRADGNGVKVGGGNLAEIRTIRVGPPFDTAVVLASDVTNPLLGEHGAAAVFAPQKGADEAGVAQLEAGMRVWADVVERDLEGDVWRDLPGAGAAGGLGFALAAFTGAQIRSGAEVIGDLVGLGDAVSGTDLVVTGEGSLDAQTEAGKAPEHVRQCAVAAGAATAVIAGRVAEGAGQRFDTALPLGSEGMTRARELVTERAFELAQRWSSR